MGVNSSNEYKKLGNAKGFPKSISRAKMITAAAAAAVISSGAQSKEISIDLPEQVLDKVHQIQTQPSGSQMRLGTINGGYRLEKSASGVRIYQGDTFLGTMGDGKIEATPKISKESNKQAAPKLKFAPGPNGMGVYGATSGGTQFSANMGKYSQYGVTADLGVAGELSKNSALALNVEAGPKLQRLLTTLGFSFENGVLMFSAEHLGVKNKFQFSSGEVEKMVRQNSVGTTLKLYFTDEILKSLEVSGYITKAQSYQLANKEYSINNDTIFAIYDNFRNIAGGEKRGVQTKFNFDVSRNGQLTLGLNYESLTYDMKYSSSQKHAQLGGSVGYSHNFGAGLKGDINLRTGVSSTDIEAGISKTFQDGSRFGVVVRQTQGKNGGQNDSYVGVQYSIPFGGKTTASSPINLNNVPRANSLRDEYNQKDSYAPSRAEVSRLVQDVISQNKSFKSSTTLHLVDQKSVRILEIDKTKIPDGVSLLNEQGDLTINYKIASINSILKNGSSFSNTGEFQVVGEAFVIRSRNFKEPAKGTTDIYNINLAKVGGGQVNVTIDVRSGSIIISKVVVEDVNAIDKTGLNTLISQAEAKTEATYTPTSWAAFFTVLKTAIILRDNVSATQTQVDETIVKLQKAIDNLTEKANFSALTTKLQEAQQLYNTGSGKYTQESLTKLSQAITSAQTTGANLNATQTEVDNAVVLLTTAIQGIQLLNKAPTVVSAIGNVSQDEGTALNINVTGKFNDPEGGTLLYSGTNFPTGITINNTTGVISGTLPTVTSDTPYVVTVRATDAGGLYVEQNFTITVK
ncbi:MAG: Ig domain-containing protein, partial [Candidatus Altimarinota bacterium]